MTHKFLRQFLRTELIHKVTDTAEPAVKIIAKQWKHNDSEIQRNLRSMLGDSRDSLPCHLALVLNVPSRSVTETEQIYVRKHCSLDIDVVVGHVKLAKADGRSDGACCISYSLVVDDAYRGCGFGRVLVEETESYARSLGLSYMYLSTNDKVSFYEHLGYKQCEPVSSLGNNSKRLNANQVSALEGLFAKRLNITNPTDCSSNTWLRKRLIESYKLQEPLEPDKLISLLNYDLNSLYEDQAKSIPASYFVAYHIPFYWQQQTGPSCGIAAMNMVNSSINAKSLDTTFSICNDCCSASTLIDITDPTPLSVALSSGVSNDGELFCAYNYQYVAQKSLSLCTNVIDEWNIISIISEINIGFPVIIPYDRSLSDHKPGKFEGTQAHWAVIVGYITPEDVFPTNELEKVVVNMADHTSNFVLVDTSSSSGSEISCNSDLLDEILLICMHGMSKRPFICPFRDLYESNNQLLNSKSKFYLASEDLKHLRGKILTINHG